MFNVSNQTCLEILSFSGFHIQEGLTLVNCSYFGCTVTAPASGGPAEFYGSYSRQQKKHVTLKHNKHFLFNYTNINCKYRFFAFKCKRKHYKSVHVCSLTKTCTFEKDQISII